MFMEILWPRHMLDNVMISLIRQTTPCNGQVLDGATGATGVLRILLRALMLCHEQHIFFSIIKRLISQKGLSDMDD